MIVKVQTSLPDGERALIYSEGKNFAAEWDAKHLPQHIRYAVQQAKGKLFFYTKFDEDRNLVFGAQAPWQDW